MSTIIERIRQRREQELTGLWRRYAELLTLDPADDPALVEEMIEVCERLDREPADMEHDRRVLSAVRAARERIERGTGQSDAIDKAYQAMEKHRKQMAIAIEKLKDKQRELEAAHSELHGRYSGAQSAVHELNRLKMNHPELLAHEKPASVDDLG